MIFVVSDQKKLKLLDGGSKMAELTAAYDVIIDRQLSFLAEQAPKYLLKTKFFKPREFRVSVPACTVVGVRVCN